MSSPRGRTRFYIAKKYMTMSYENSLKNFVFIQQHPNQEAKVPGAFLLV